MLELLRDPIWQSFGAILGVIAVIVAYSISISYRSSLDQVRKFREKIDQAESRVAEQPEKVKPAWDLARVTLEAYFNRNLSQVTSIFWLCVFVMLAGFAIIIWGIALAIQSPDSTLPAVITGLAGVITELIGATFLFIYRSTMEQAVSYTQTLERINSVGMAMQILDTIPNNAKDDNLKNSTKASVVKMLMQQAYSIEIASEKTPENAQDKNAT